MNFLQGENAKGILAQDLRPSCFFPIKITRLVPLILTLICFKFAFKFAELLEFYAIFRICKNKQFIFGDWAI
jgi:hypothetical protein